MASGLVIHGGGVITTGPGGTASTPNTLQGSLVFDNGLPAAGVNLRLYNIGFGGNDTQLGQAASDAQGKYLFTYSLPAGTAPAPQALNFQVRALDSLNKWVTPSAIGSTLPRERRGQFRPYDDTRLIRGEETTSSPKACVPALTQTKERKNSLRA